MKKCVVQLERKIKADATLSMEGQNNATYN